jgi:hypothetical protein
MLTMCDLIITQFDHPVQQSDAFQISQEWYL